MNGREQGNQTFIGLSFVGKHAECLTGFDHPRKRDILARQQWEFSRRVATIIDDVVIQYIYICLFIYLFTYFFHVV